MLITLKKFIKYLTGDKYIYSYIYIYNAHITYINIHIYMFIHMYEIAKYPPKGERTIYKKRELISTRVFISNIVFRKHWRNISNSQRKCFFSPKFCSQPKLTEGKNHLRELKQISQANFCKINLDNIKVSVSWERLRCGNGKVT